MDAAIGIDFGTTNSSVARARMVAPERSPRVDLVTFPGAAGAAPTASFRSILYLEQNRERGRSTTESFTGPAAIDRYLSRHLLDAEPRPGRLIQSLKSYLPVRTLTGTEVFGRRYTVEDLVSRILADLRSAAEAGFSMQIGSAVVGRPVRFVGATTPGDDAFAIERLTSALGAAGLAEVKFLEEPVAAALAYEATLERDELILIGDFGGGTSDFTLIHVGPSARARPSAERILGTAGLPLAGDAFDAKLVRRLVSPALGSDSMARSLGKTLPAVPAWIYANLERWHYLSFLRTRNVEEILRTARLRALEPEKIEALMTLVNEDLGYQLHQAVQRTKVALSDEPAAEFRFCEPGLDLRTAVTRVEFESWIAPELAWIEQTVDDLLGGTHTTPGQVDRVFLTGGTSFVPAVRRIFEERFGAGRVTAGEAFTSVARGLALHALRLVGEEA